MADSRSVVDVYHYSSSESSDTACGIGPRKRRRVHRSGSGGSSTGRSNLEDVDTDPTSLDEQPATRPCTAPARNEQVSMRGRRRRVTHVTVPGPAYPRSQYLPMHTDVPSAPVAEHEAFPSLLQAAHNAIHADARDETEYVFVHLEDFAIYRTNSEPQTVEEEDSREEGTKRKPLRGSHANELIGLQQLQVHKGPGELLFDGVLSCRGVRRYVQGVPFSTLSIDYGEVEAGIDGCVFIQSQLAKRHHPTIWYQLDRPAQEYARFYNPFQWLAQFTRYFVDCLMDTENVGLQHFRSTFYRQLQDKYAGREGFHTWLRNAPLLCGSRDFRATINANISFLWKECYGLPDSKKDLLRQPLWGEVDELQLTAIPRQQHEKKCTVVTPYAYNSFKHMYFADQLAMHIPEPEISRQMARRKLELGLTPLGTRDGCCPEHVIAPKPVQVRPGDVVALRPDTNGPWKSKAAVWYGCVQQVRDDTPGRELHIIWLYDPRDTTIGTATYLFKNELFLSDNCDDRPLSDVIGKVNVEWYVKNPAATPGLFVRQKFRTVHEEDTNDFVSLKQSDFSCGCGQKTPVYTECAQSYSVNQTVLVQQTPDSGKDAVALQPAQILAFDEGSKRVLVRLLELATVTDPNARLNELRSTSLVVSVAPSRIVRKCHVRFVDHHARDHKSGIPTPYDRDGAGDCFFIRRPSPQDRDQEFQEPQDVSELQNDSDGMGHVRAKAAKLRGMGIFCGGGSLDRGLEDGGAVEFKYAVDWAERALHTYRANCRNAEDVKFWLGSVNDYHAKALCGMHDAVVAGPGQVDLISAGSPCPGFSMLQGNKLSTQSRANASMIASVVSFVDLYSPKYCIVENVVAMTYPGGENKDENVFCQIISAFVAMGYQVQQFLMEAWTHGSSQQRSRLFIVASAPGLEPFLEPPYTHQHPPSMQMKGRALGRLTNGLAFSMRKHNNDFKPPFAHIGPRQATRDLPDIADAQVQLCTQFPDHRTPCELSRQLRTCIALTPIRPEGIGLVQAYHANRVPLGSETWKYIQGLNKSRRRLNSKTFTRVLPDHLFPTIITAMQVHDGNTGQCLHWSQNRMLTVMEARRAQGFLDDEVIIGSPAQQIKIIGNSVDRKVSTVLGLALRESWLKSSDTRHAEVSSVFENPCDATPAANRDMDVEVTTRPRSSTKSTTDYRGAASTYDLERGAWEDAADYGNGELTPRDEPSIITMMPSRDTFQPTLDGDYTTLNLISFVRAETTILQDACDHLTCRQAIQARVQQRIGSICRYLHSIFGVLKIHTPVSRAVLDPTFKPPLFFRFIELISEGGDQDLCYSRKQLVKVVSDAVEQRGPFGCELGSEGEKEAWADFHQAINAAVRLYGYSHEEVGVFVGYVKGLHAVVAERKDIGDLRLYGPQKRPTAVVRVARTVWDNFK
ncbi:C5-methyltransferase family [Teratosphaeria destructans]|uniref:DNA (cytosine-5-)-methyltransferase n=1 Tax=Teratosphaeria destructans TaxID=418781 RepID=A0A9W7W6L0_9PEZI|nr:C5-methyltransferase family [Teratosphaeria destructans]